VPSGRLAKASSVGAKTLKGPDHVSVSTEPAAFAAAIEELIAPADVIFQRYHLLVL